jgi:uncharacterized protein
MSLAWHWQVAGTVQIARAAGLAAFAILVAIAPAHALTPIDEAGGRAIHDLAEVLPPSEEARLEAIHRELLASTGVAMVLVTVPRLEGETIEALAVRAGTTWGVGRKGEDRGIVIAFAREDRKIFVATGYGVEGFLPDGKVGALIDQYALPALRADRFAEGLFALDVALAQTSADALGATLSDAPAIQPAAGAERPVKLGLKEILIGLALLGLLGYLAIRHPWLLLFFLSSGRGGRGSGGFGGGGGFDGFGGGGFGGGGAGRSF